MNARGWAVSMLLISMLYGSTALAQSQSWQQCKSVQQRTETHNRLKELFIYAQIAERPKHQDNNYMQNCTPSQGALVSAQTDLKPLRLTASAYNSLIDIMQRNELRRVYMTPEKDRDESLSIGCKSQDGSTTLPITFKIFAYTILIGDFLNLGLSFSAEIVEENENGNITKVAWSPYYDETKKKIVYSARGTDITDIREVLANYVGDGCAYPAIKLAVSHVCDLFSKDVRKDSDTNESKNFAISTKELKKIRKVKRYSTVLTGHSLGGQAVQYVADNPPQVCSVNNKLTSDNFRAYAFASTRNPPENGEGRISESEKTNFLESYLIHGDRVLRRLGLGEEQTGTVTIYMPAAGSNLVAQHRIEDIQRSICHCLQEQGKISSQ